mmetsp:Transcript_7162/g.16415  ORF Transcript_7162/g.16415 Transcript_7162/m.16415 type:complete len:88 (+) Transcript_7162:46-309(+)
MQVRVDLFAKAKELAGGKTFITVTLEKEGEGISGESLFGLVCAAEPALKPLAGSAFLAINDEYVTPDQVVTLKAGDDVAVIPPISGG